MRLSELHITTKLSVPVGIVKAWTNVAVPNGWLECNGQTLDGVTNPEYERLFSILSNTFGGTGLNNFQVPDLRAEFIRGYDNGKGVDVGRAFASTQAGQLGEHNHPSGSLTAPGANAPHGHPAGNVPGANAPHNHSSRYQPAGGNSVAPGFFPQGGGFYNPSANSNNPFGNNSANAPHGHSASPNGAANAPHVHGISGNSGVTGGTSNANEIRPNNCALLYIIKF